MISALQIPLIDVMGLLELGWILYFWFISTKPGESILLCIWTSKNHVYNNNNLLDTLKLQVKVLHMKNMKNQQIIRSNLKYNQTD